MGSTPTPGFIMHKPRILIINGIESAGVESVDRIGLRLAALGYEVVDINLKVARWYNGRSKKVRNENLERIRAIARPGDHVIAHSNGCRLVYDAMRGGTEFGTVVLFAPALNRSVTFFPFGYKSITVVHNPYDWALFWGSILPGHIWGPLGRRGYNGVSERVTNVGRPSHEGGGHGHYFNESHIQDSMRIVLSSLQGKPLGHTILSTP